MYKNITDMCIHNNILSSDKNKIIKIKKHCVEHKLAIPIFYWINKQKKNLYFFYKNKNYATNLRVLSTHHHLHFISNEIEFSLDFRRKKK